MRCGNKSGSFTRRTMAQLYGKTLIRTRYGPRSAHRTLTLHPREQEQALRAARLREQADDFKLAYACRAGVEGTHSQAVRVCGLRRWRYIGQPKTHLQHILSAVAINLLRIGAYSPAPRSCQLVSRPLPASWLKLPSGIPSNKFATNINSVVNTRPYARLGRVELPAPGITSSPSVSCTWIHRSWRVHPSHITSV
jgi:hypothetical protein